MIEERLDDREQSPRGSLGILPVLLIHGFIIQNHVAVPVRTAQHVIPHVPAIIRRDELTEGIEVLERTVRLSTTFENERWYSHIDAAF